MHNISQYRFEQLNQDNLTHLIYLYQHAFHFKTEMSFLKKKYNTNLFGAQYIGYLAFDNKTSLPAAYYGVFPITCIYENKTILAAQSGDTMTHPNHQGKGLFIQLATLTFNLAKEKGIQFIFGFPNKNSMPGFIRKLNWVHYADVNNYQLKINVPPLDKVAKKWPFTNGIYQSWINYILSDKITDNLFENSLKSQLPNAGYVEHDQTFFNYKCYYPNYTIKLNGVLCKIKIDGRLWVGDVDYCDENTFDKLLNDLKALAAKLFCSTIQFSVFNDSKFDQYLKKNYSVISKNPVCSLDLSDKIDSKMFAFQAFDFDTY